MQKVKRSRSKKSTDVDQKISRKSIKSDHLHVPLTPSTFRNVKSTASRPSTVKSVGRVAVRKSVVDREPLVRLSHAPPSEVPGNVAVHFASFYQNGNPSLPHSFNNEEKRFGERNKSTMIRNSPKMEFTRQMVYKLENSAGTQNYGREVTALLDETVESPGFDLKLPPIDNCSPNNNPDYYYPLWYTDPSKMPQVSREHFRNLKGRYRVGVKKLGEEVRKAEESVVSDSSDMEMETETEMEEEEEEEEDGFRRYCSSESIGSSVEDNKKVDKRFSSSWSSQNSCETETEEDDEDEESVNWETEIDDEEDGVVGLKIRG